MPQQKDTLEICLDKIEAEIGNRRVKIQDFREKMNVLAGEMAGLVEAKDHIVRERDRRRNGPD